MSTTMLDTYSMIKKLQAAGVPEKQAEAQVAVVLAVAEKSFATKADVDKLGTDLKEFVRNEMKAYVTQEFAEKTFATKQDLKTLENRLIIKLGGGMTSLMIIGFAFLSYTHH